MDSNGQLNVKLLCNMRFTDETDWPLYTAPELLLLSDTYSAKDCKEDIWQIGLLTHLLLVGSHAFYDHTKMADTLRTSVLENEPMFQGLTNQTSQAGVKFIQRCLKKDREYRPLVDELLADQWLL